MGELAQPLARQGLAGLEVVRSLNDMGHVTWRPIVVVDWTNEEGARFSPPMVASGMFTGRYGLDWARDLIGDDSARFCDELARIGYAGDGPCEASEIDAYFELHIEQGPILDAEKRQVGGVTGAVSAIGGDCMKVEQDIGCRSVPFPEYGRGFVFERYDADMQADPLALCA